MVEWTHVNDYAHTHPDFPKQPEKWEPLFSEECGTLEGKECSACEKLDPNHGHLNKVAYLAGCFAADMFPSGSKESGIADQWGQIAGWWHDLGKFAPGWQRYLGAKVDPHQDEVQGKIDHSTAGAQFAVKAHTILGHLLAFIIAGHHSGLLDSKSNSACQWARLKKEGLPEIESLPEIISQLKMPELPGFLIECLKRRTANEAFSINQFTRLLFSSLVDADFLATEAFMNPASARLRQKQPKDILFEIDRLLAERLNAFGPPAENDTVNQQRDQVLTDCVDAAATGPGLFTLTVPTGGGKTLSSLSFALKHALRHGQRRIIYVVPFTSIIEQNAGVIREIVKPLKNENFTPLLEHHSSFDCEKESEQSRLAAENWDAPIIITTAVQFYESLFAAKTSRSRKVHNIANAVIILDECQTLPVDLLHPCLRVIQELTDHYNTTAVLCTATQPAIRQDKDCFPIGLRGCREIIKDTKTLFSVLKRVDIKHVGVIPNHELIRRIKQCHQVLCIVNRRKHAQELFQLLESSEEHFHLSALMCPEHRSIRLQEIHERLARDLPTRLISTQLIEAGVDIDFPVVYRALAGLDSIAQAAGRCNRHGRLEGMGQTFIFKPEAQGEETYFRETAQVAAQICELYDDLLGEAAIRHYFDLYYYEQKARWDKYGILDNSNLRFEPGRPDLPFHFQFRTIAENFRLIENWQVPVIIPYDDRATNLISELGNESIHLHRNLLRGLQRYTVQISPRVLSEYASAFEPMRDGQYHVLICKETHYSDDFGLTFDKEYTSNAPLVC